MIKRYLRRVLRYLDRQLWDENDPFAENIALTVIIAIVAILAILIIRAWQ